MSGRPAGSNVPDAQGQGPSHRPGGVAIMAPMPQGPTLDPRVRRAAIIFDTDGVLTDTARVHARAWKRLFDQVLTEDARERHVPFVPFDLDRDYRAYVDGKARADGASSFLESRDLHLPRGDPDDGPGTPTVCGLANQKDEMFLAELAASPAVAFPGTLRFLDAADAHHIPTAAVSASRNATTVLEAAGVLDRFSAIVDGVESQRLGLPGKPDPSLFLEAAQRLGVTPDTAAMVEDAVVGVEAGRRGGFGLVIGVDRAGDPDPLVAAGAELVVADLGELVLSVDHA